MFVIDVFFRSEKYWVSFHVGEQESADDDETDMKIATHTEDCDHDRSPLLEDRDCGHNPFIN